MAIEAYGSDKEVIVRNYTDSVSAKEYITEILIPKYFKRIPISGLKVGEIGLVSEYMGDIVDDGGYGVAMALNETFITRAVIDESIYAAAATFDLGYDYAEASVVPITLQINYEDIINHAVDRQVYIDKDTKILVNGFEYTLDYDIRLTYTYIGGVIQFSAVYDMKQYNPISNLNTPYIACRTTRDWVLLFIRVRECKRIYQTNLITDNLVFTASPIDLPFDNMICGLTAYYRYNDETILMTNKVKYSLPMNTPFFFYRLKDENTVEISFASGKGNWRPDFNSQIDFIIYTTNGDKANFPITGDKECTVIRTGERYIYNEDLRMVAIAYNASVGGSDQPGIEMIRNDTILAFNTAHVLMTDNDISLFFENYAKRHNTVAKFFKRRDDPTGRLFGMFNIINQDNYIYETLTAKCIFHTTDINENNGHISANMQDITIYSGDMWRYYDDADNELDQHTMLTILPGNFGLGDEIPEEEEENVFVNPFIMKINRYPGIVAYYNPLVSYDGLMKQDFYENSVLNHFIVTRIDIYRGVGENKYQIDIVLVPSIQEDTYDDHDQYRNYKYSYPANPDDTYSFSFAAAKINMNDVNTNNGQVEILPDGTLNPDYRKSILEYMRDTYGVYPNNGNVVINTDITEPDLYGFEGKYVYNTIRDYIPVTPEMFPLRVVMSAETTRETCYTEMVCIGEEEGTYTFRAYINTVNDIDIVQGTEVLSVLLGEKPYDTKGIAGTAPTAKVGTTFISTTNTKIHIYTLYKAPDSGGIVVNPVLDKKFNFDDHTGTPPITTIIKTHQDIFDMRLSAIVNHIRSLDSTKNQNPFTNDFYVHNTDDGQYYRWSSENTPVWIPTAGLPADQSYLFEFSFNHPPAIYNTDPIVFSNNVSAAYACLPYPDGTYSAIIQNESTVMNLNTGATYQFTAESGRWLLLGSPSLFSDPTFRGWNITDGFSNDSESFNILEQWTQMRSAVVFNGNMTDGYRADIGLVPLFRYDLCKDKDKVSYVIRAMVEQYRVMSELVKDRLEENTGIDFKLYNTCGRGVFYKIGVTNPDSPNWTRLDHVSLRIKFMLGVREELLYEDTALDVKEHIKAYIENLNIDEATIFNVSNLQTSIETNITNVRYLIFLGINDYDTMYQRIKLDDPYKVDMSMYEFQIYVPEFLTIKLENIDIIRGE